MVGVLLIFVGLFGFFFAGLLWAQRARSQSPAAARRRGRMLVLVGWGVLGLVVAAIAAVRRDVTYTVAGTLLAIMNAVLFWRLYRE